MTSRPAIQCVMCRHRRSTLLNPDPNPRQTCTAFPAGIPPEIWGMSIDHRQPFPGDHGIRWEPVVEGVDFPDWPMDVP